MQVLETQPLAAVRLQLAVESREDKYIWLIPVVVFLNKACSWFPYSWRVDLFLLWDNPDPNEYGIPMQLFVYVLAYHSVFLIIWYRNWKLSPSIASPLYKNWFFVEVLSLIDLFVIYEHPYFFLDLGFTSYGVEFSDLKVLLYIYFMVQWRSTFSNSY
ncbi:MAG TPA: hypothetical protein VGK47_06025 [Nitrososphaeraceae archaeon]